MNPLIIYVSMTTNKRLLISESHGDLNRFTPYMRNLIYTINMLPMTVDVCHSYASYRQSLYVATFREVINRVERIYCSQEKGLPSQSTARQLTNSRVHT
jgi:endonuclease IV